MMWETCVGIEIPVKTLCQESRQEVTVAWLQWRWRRANRFVTVLRKSCLKGFAEMECERKTRIKVESWVLD